ncbi:MAG: hypothetical protein R3E39_20080 [Anaerolineae bacterium]
MTTSPIRDGSHDFDFFVGTWKVQHRRLRERLVGSTGWEEFEGQSICRNLRGNLANMDEGWLEREIGHIDCMTVRLYNRQTGEWSLYWAASGSGALDIPMIGSFDKQNGTGHFYAHETHNDRHVYSRFIWSNITQTSCHWEQALSADGGQTWETNWTMDFTRVP